MTADSALSGAAFNVWAAGTTCSHGLGTQFHYLTPSSASNSTVCATALLELGLACSNIRRKEIISTSIWEDTLVAVVPKGHPTLRYRRIPLDELLKYPMIGSDPGAYGGYHHQIDRLLRSGNVPPRITEWAKSMDMLLTLVSAGHGVAIASASRMGACRRHNIVVRPLAAKRPLLMTYLLQHESLNSAAAADFIERMHAHESYGYDEGEGWEDGMEDRRAADNIALTQQSYGRECARPH